LPGSVIAINLSDDEGVIWERGTNVYVKYAEQDSSNFGENDHPVVLKMEEISRALGSLRFLENDRSDADQERQSIFTVEQIDVLSQNLAKGLAKAKSNQDINFALDRRSRKLLSLKANRLFVAGRAFYKDEKLNIIIGEYDRGADEGFEAVYDPTRVGIVRYNFDHGRRTKRSKGLKKPIITVQGIENKQIEGTDRSDWLVIDLKSVSEALDMKAKLQKSEEQARKREEILDLLGIEEASPSHPAAAAPARAPDSIEERLTVLGRLKDKGLISDEEYAMKRKQILNEL
jgi:hypothetical protein